MNPTKNVTINQVAREASVSIQTVSRVVNNRYDVADETRVRVQEAIDRLGYQPNAIARGLASRRSRTLGLVTHDFNDQFFTQVVTGAEEEAHRQDYFFLLGSSNCKANELPKYMRLLTERHVDGVLFAREGGSNEQEHIFRIASEGKPVVIVGYHAMEFGVNSVDINNLGGGRQAADCFVEHGHQVMGCITGPFSSQAALDRLEGFRQGLEEAGLGLSRHQIVEGAFGRASYGAGYNAMKKLLEQAPNLTGVFAHNDRMAVGAISAIREVGLKIPQDISIIGYDDTPEAEFSSPPLTTIRQPEVELGARAVQVLLRKIEDPTSELEQILMDTELIIRSSVAWRKEIS
jgi:LacI family transcriptional regulator